MLKIYFFMILLFTSFSLFAQQGEFEEVSAEITFVSSQHVYLKIGNMRGLEQGDTLFIKLNGNIDPVFEVDYLSSHSCAAKNLTSVIFKPNDTTILFCRIKEREELKEKEFTGEMDQLDNMTKPDLPVEKSISKQNISGRFSVSSYSNFSNYSRLKDYQRWRYVISLDARNLFDSDLSFETYTNFSYRSDQWNAKYQDIWDKLKIYSFSLDYKLSDRFNISVGRKINNNLSNIGSVDGLQVNADLSHFKAGFVAGSRPDYRNFSFNTDYVQLGAYVSRTDTMLNSSIQNTVSIFQQTMNLKTDRRFLYFQHSNNLLPNLFLFFTTEIDLYKRENGVDKNIFELTNLYLSGRFTPAGWISLSTSYDIRKNVMYYETYKNIADSLFEAETRRGLRTTLNIRPLRFTSINLQYGTRFNEGESRRSNNYGAAISYSRIPFIYTSANINYTYLSTTYLKGIIYGAALGKDLFDGLLNTNVGYKRIEYNYSNNTFALNQNIIQFDAGVRIFERDYLSISYESIFEQSNTNSRLYINFTKRF